MDKNNNGRSMFKKYKKIILIFSKLLNIFSKKVQIKLFNKLDRGEGKLKLVFRYAILKNVCKNCGDNIFIGEYVKIKDIENLSLGNNVSIHCGSYLYAKGEISIGDNVSISSGCKIISFNHSYNNAEVPIKYDDLILNKIDISDDVWIGVNSVILSGVSIENRVIVGAGSVVSKKLLSGFIYAGVPAKKIKKIM